LLAASAARQEPEIETRTKTLAELLMVHARSDRMRLGVCLEPALSLDYAQAHACLSRLGYPDPAFDKLLEQSQLSQARSGRERPPHRVLEQQWIAGLLGISPAGLRKHNGSAAAASVLGNPLDLLSGGREDVYALTHALMFVAGGDLPPRPLPRRRSAILSEAEAVLAWCLDESDYDLGGEVLLAWPLTGSPWSPAAAFGFRVLARVEDVVGFLPSAGTRVERLNKLQGDERTNYLMASAYHTAYVMGLLCAASLRPGCAPPVAIPTRKAQPGSAKAILTRLGAGAAHWREELDRLTEPERDSLTGLILTAALRRRVRDRDFDGVRELLSAGYEWGLADSPAASQAAEMLERLASFGEMARPAADAP